MQFEIVNTTARPMLYVTRTSSMDSDEIGGVMGEAFAAIGDFFAKRASRPPARRSPSIATGTAR